METLKALLHGSSHAASEQERSAAGEGGLRESLRDPPSSAASRWATPSLSLLHRLVGPEREGKGGSDLLSSTAPGLLRAQQRLTWC